MGYKGGMINNIAMGNEITEMLTNAISAKLSILSILNSK